MRTTHIVPTPPGTLRLLLPERLHPPRNNAGPLDSVGEEIGPCWASVVQAPGTIGDGEVGDGALQVLVGAGCHEVVAVPDDHLLGVPRSWWSVISSIQVSSDLSHIASHNPEATSSSSMSTGLHMVKKGSNFGFGAPADRSFSTSSKRVIGSGRLRGK